MILQRHAAMFHIKEKLYQLADIGTKNLQDNESSAKLEIIESQSPSEGLTDQEQSQRGVGNAQTEPSEKPLYEGKARTD